MSCLVRPWKLSYLLASGSASGRNAQRFDRFFMEKTWRNTAVDSDNANLMGRVRPRARVRNTPISENSFVGAALGAAMTGSRPVVELMFMDFAMVALDLISMRRPRSLYVWRPNQSTAGHPLSPGGIFMEKRSRPAFAKSGSVVRPHCRFKGDISLQCV